MVANIKIFGVKEALFAFRELPRRVHFKHLRIALNAGGGIIRDRAATFARRDTGLLAKSLGVKVKIPDASFNVAHHGKPAYAVIGPKRKSGRFMRLNSKGLLKGFGSAQKGLVAERKRLNEKVKTLNPLKRERAAVKNVGLMFPDAVYRNPSRYAHLVEKGHRKGQGRSAAKAYPFLAPAVAATKGQVIAKVQEKLSIGLNQEAHVLGRSGHSVALGVG